MKYDRVYNLIFNILFSVSTVLYMLKFVNIAKIDGLNTLILASSVFLLLLHTVIYGFNKLKLFCLSFVLFLCFLIYFQGLVYLELLNFFLIYSTLRVSNTQFNKTHWSVFFIFFILVVLFANAGMIKSVFVFRTGGLVRGSLGFVHPNSLGLMAYAITLNTLYVFNPNRYKITFYCSLLIFNYFIFAITDSRTSFLISLLIILSCFIFDFRGTLYKVVKSSFIYIVMVVSSLFIILATTYFEVREPFIFLNKLFTNRIYSGNVFVAEYGYNLFGNFIKGALPTLAGDVIIDSGYVGLILRLGVLFFIGYLLFMLLRIKQNIFLLKEAILISSVFISLMFESYGFSGFIFPVLFVDFVGKRKEL